MKMQIRWLFAELSRSRSHHCVQSLFLFLYTGVTTLHRGTISKATVLHSQVSHRIGLKINGEGGFTLGPYLMDCDIYLSLSHSTFNDEIYSIASPAVILTSSTARHIT